MPGEVADEVLDVLKTHPNRACSTAEILESLGGVRDGEAVVEALKDLRSQGVIEQDLLGGWFVLSPRRTLGSSEEQSPPPE